MIIKNYTDLEQSKKLSEILPIESADMVYIKHSSSDNPTWEFNEDLPPMILGNIPISEMTVEVLPCWSLAALLNVLPKIYYPVKDHKTDLILGKPKDEWCVLYWDTTGMQHGEETLGDNPVDACVNMIVKLKELNLI